VPAPGLRELQGAFWRHLAAFPDDDPGRPIAPELAAALVGTDVLAADARLAIYARMYFWRLLDVLRDDHPRTAAVLGDDAFREAARGYLIRHPSEHPSVANVGHALAAFLAADPRPGAPPWVPDLARLEWARREVFVAPDATALGLDVLRALAPEAWPSTRFRVVPALIQVVAGWPVQRAWEAGADASPPELPPERTAIRVWRRGHFVYHASMDAREEAALARLVAGEPFASVCEAFADLPAEKAASEAASLLVTWVEDGMVCHLDHLAPERRAG
jgi:hypothetical protein